MQEIETLNMSCFLSLVVQTQNFHLPSAWIVNFRRKLWMRIAFLQKLCHHAIKNSLFPYTKKFTTQIY